MFACPEKSCVKFNASSSKIRTRPPDFFSSPDHSISATGPSESKIVVWREVTITMPSSFPFPYEARVAILNCTCPLCTSTSRVLRRSWSTNSNIIVIVGLRQTRRGGRRGYAAGRKEDVNWPELGERLYIMPHGYDCTVPGHSAPTLKWQDNARSLLATVFQ